jgi:hypothetical protein
MVGYGALRALTHPKAATSYGTDARNSLHRIEGIIMSGVLETNLKSLPALHRGKVRDIYAVGEDKLLVVRPTACRRST